MLNVCSCQTANCFNKSKGVFITGPKLKALLNPQPSWGFSGHKKWPLLCDHLIKLIIIYCFLCVFINYFVAIQRLLVAMRVFHLQSHVSQPHVHAHDFGRLFVPVYRLSLFPD
ncbi:penicillin-binding protein [Yersinia similis]|uniref:Penicillin-binding protein n=1 Tax=Yersinia similis TaxID=367190 RepID=A0ABN4CPL9_9GAMM|nr:penicillin-binding protein [Yersinia similis]